MAVKSDDFYRGYDFAVAHFIIQLRKLQNDGLEWYATLAYQHLEEEIKAKCSGHKLKKLHQERDPEYRRKQFKIVK